MYVAHRRARAANDKPNKKEKHLYLSIMAVQSGVPGMPCAQ